MPQWRKLHTKTTESLDVHDMPDDFHRLLWLLLPLALDSQGRGLDNLSWVKAKTMPLRTDVTAEMVAAAMDWYCQRGMAERYQVDGRAYFWLPSWSRYQGDTSREADSMIPAPPGSRATREPLASNSRATHEPLASNSRLEERRGEKDSEEDSEVDADAEETRYFDDYHDPLPETPRQASGHPAIRAYKRVTSRIPGDRHYRVIIDTLIYLAPRFADEQRLIDYLHPFWLAWAGRKKKNGRLYDPNNPAWLTEWAVNGEIPLASPDEPQVTNKSRYSHG